MEVSRLMIFQRTPSRQSGTELRHVTGSSLEVESIGSEACNKGDKAKDTCKDRLFYPSLDRVSRILPVRRLPPDCPIGPADRPNGSASRYIVRQREKYLQLATFDQETHGFRCLGSSGQN